jgi:hypothetical protein
MADGDWRRPSPRLLRLRRFEVLALGCAGVVLGGVLTLANTVAGIVCAIAAILLGLLAERFVRRRFHAWGYVERDDDLLVRRGVMFSRLSVVPYGRMQFIDVTAGPLERSVGLATVRMHTAAAASDARIPGLEQAEANRLRDRLAELGEAQAAGI